LFLVIVKLRGSGPNAHSAPQWNIPQEHSGASFCAGANHVGWVAAASLEYGADEVAKAYFSSQTDQSVRAGHGIGLAVGAHFRRAASRFDCSGTVGLKYVTNKASNVDININRIVLEGLASYSINDDWWVGAGPVLHTSGRFHGGGLVPDLEFDSTASVTAKLGWHFLAASYTAIDYKDQFGNKYSASNIGVQLIGRF
jgi:hypothetical protein